MSRAAARHRRSSRYSAAPRRAWLARRATRCSRARGCPGSCCSSRTTCRCCWSSVVPFVGALAAPLLKPVFAVGFLAAAWTQERGGTPRHPPAVPRLPREPVGAGAARRRASSSASRSRCCATALVDGGKLLDADSRRAAKPTTEVAARADTRVAARDAARRRCARCPTLLALWCAPALVVFQDAGRGTALATSLRAALANWRPIVRLRARGCSSSAACCRASAIADRRCSCRRRWRRSSRAALSCPTSSCSSRRCTSRTT